MNLNMLLINKKYANPELLAKKFSGNKPFPYIVLDKFFDEKFLDKLRNALKKEHYELKEADLFTFMQSNDLNRTKNIVIKTFVKFLKGKEFTNYIEKLSESKLKIGKISIHATAYTNTHYLLCHDDEVDDRVVALMIYLSDLENKDGGKLRLFEKNNALVEIIPKFNRFVIFKISKKSLHDVEEIYTDAIRLTLGWWYYDK